VKILTKAVVVAIAFLVSGLALAPNASASFIFNWAGAPTTPQRWVPAPINDWDLIATDDLATDLAGTMQAQHGSDCSAPLATHQIQALADSVFICSNHLMTALNGGGDAPKGYAAAYFSPAQMVDMSSGVAQIDWQVSTQRQSLRDWWDLWLTPFNENLVVPLGNFPAFNGPPKDALHFKIDNGVCSHNQADGNGTIVVVTEYHNFQPVQETSNSRCVEDAIGGAISATTRTPFELDISQGHARMWIPGAPANLQTLADLNVSLSSAQAVVQWGHHSYNPTKGCTCSPNTFHWSNVSIAPSIPFSMLRPNGTNPVHAGINTHMVLPQTAADGAMLRFAALGSIQVSFDGGAFVQAQRQAQDGPASDGSIHEEQTSNYWMSVPVGAQTIDFQGGPNSLSSTWWVQDVSVWSQTVKPIPSPSPSISPTGTPLPTPTSQPTPININAVPCTVALSTGSASGTCTGSFQPN